jgi:hypothetical protein
LNDARINGIWRTVHSLLHVDGRLLEHHLLDDGEFVFLPLQSKKAALPYRRAKPLSHRES